MSEEHIRLRDFLKAFTSDTFTLMSGPLSVIFAAVALWVPSSHPKVLFGCLAIAAGVVAAYRVWRNERLASATALDAQRLEAAGQVAAKDAQIATLSQQLEAYKSIVDVSLKLGGTPPSQAITVTTNPTRPIRVSHLEYMTSDETAVGTEDVSLEGTTVTVPLNYPMLQKVWNAYRADRNDFDHSGPAKIGLVISIAGKTRQLILPVAMKAHFISNTNYIHITGSKIFIG
jgi:hypothetical protein